jgi:hypothetical protein
MAELPVHPGEWIVPVGIVRSVVDRMTKALAGDLLAFRAEQVSLRFVADYWRVSDAGVRRVPAAPQSCS